MIEKFADAIKANKYILRSNGGASAIYFPQQAAKDSSGDSVPQSPISKCECKSESRKLSHFFCTATHNHKKLYV